jgi:hypothetical protein
VAAVVARNSNKVMAASIVSLAKSVLGGSFESIGRIIFLVFGRNLLAVVKTISHLIYFKRNLINFEITVPRLRVFENRALRRIFGPKKDKVTEEWRKLHNGDLHNLYSSPNTIRQIKLRMIGWDMKCAWERT